MQEKLLPTLEYEPVARPTRRNRVLVGLLIALVLLVKFFPSQSSPKPRSVIFFVSDGMGPASLSLTRLYLQYRDQLPYNHTLFLDSLFIGSLRTRSLSSLITDSAAGATAFACGLKTYNGAIGVDSNNKACTTLLESYKNAGYNTGLVVTTGITDATPGAFSAHVAYRLMEDEIADQQIHGTGQGRVVDLIIGGGRCHFHGCRNDDRNLLEEAKAEGWNIANDKESLAKADKLPLLSLLASYDIPFDIDRGNEYPTLAEQTQKALEMLKDSEKGFFLLVEGSRIDHAGHFNDPAAQVREVLAYDEAWQTAVRFAEQYDGDIVVLGTSDHETGGLSVAKQINETYPEYMWLPEILDQVQHLGEYMVHELRKLKEKHDFSIEDVRKMVKDYGIKDATEEELLKVMEGGMDAFVTMVNLRAQIGWLTHGHSAVDVNIYGWDKGRGLNGLEGNVENIDIGKWMKNRI